MTVTKSVLIVPRVGLDVDRANRLLGLSGRIELELPLQPDIK